MYDVMNNLQSKTIKCLDKGHVTLVDVMPRLVPDDQKTADCAIVQAARVSYGQGTKTVNEDRGLIRYLLRHTHTTPLEMVVFKFHMKLPIFCARQAIRHRTVSVNEVSGRYSVLKDEFYYPDPEDVRQQSKTNKQGSEVPVEEGTATDFLGYLTDLCADAYTSYEKFLAQGIGKEQARMVLPLNLYTEWYWKIDLHNLFHFLGLRCDAHAQKEIRVFAEAMLELITPIVPIAVEAWNDYHHYRGAAKLSRLEIEAIKKSLAGKSVKALESDNKREQAEWVEKAKLFNFQVEQ
jgi:thymidylate synthase (FAD)